VAVVGDVDLAPEDGLDPFAPGRLVEVDRTGEGAVIGERDGGHLELGGALREIRYPAGAVEDRVLGVDVKVDEGSFGHGESRITPARDDALQDAGVSGRRTLAPGQWREIFRLHEVGTPLGRLYVSA
jgi:hypothetical protein